MSGQRLLAKLTHMKKQYTFLFALLIYAGCSYGQRKSALAPVNDHYKTLEQNISNNDVEGQWSRNADILLHAYAS